MTDRDHAPLRGKRLGRSLPLLYDRFKVRAARSRLHRAWMARANANLTRSEMATFALVSLVSLIAGIGFMLGAGITPKMEDKIFSIAVSLACLGNFTLFLSRYRHFAASLCDVDRIEYFREIVREGPPTGEFLRMRWNGSRPANDF